MIFTAFMFVGLFSILNDETFFMPEPTPEIQALIDKLGDEQFRVREKASLDLEKLGWPALKGLAKAATNDPDPEIRMRAASAYKKYFAVFSDDKDNRHPSIWHMNEKKRFPDGFKLEQATQDYMGSTCKELKCRDVAREYYEKALHEMKLVKDGVAECGWHDEAVARHAGHLYIKDLLKTGVKREDAKKMLNEWADNAKIYVHYLQTENLDGPTYDWQQKPPGPMIKNDDFKQPSWGP